MFLHVLVVKRDLSIYVDLYANFIPLTNKKPDCSAKYLCVKCYAAMYYRTSNIAQMSSFLHPFCPKLDHKIAFRLPVQAGSRFSILPFFVCDYYQNMGSGEPRRGLTVLVHDQCPPILYLQWWWWWREREWNRRRTNPIRYDDLRIEIDTFLYSQSWLFQFVHPTSTTTTTTRQRKRHPNKKDETNGALCLVSHFTAHSKGRCLDLFLPLWFIWNIHTGPSSAFEWNQDLLVLVHSLYGTRLLPCFALSKLFPFESMSLQN